MALLETIQQDDNLSKEQKAYLSELINSKKYGLVWEEKSEGVQEELRTHIPVLKEDANKRILNNPSAPNHLIIEGDNYQALTDLCYIYDGRVDVIYIDPPYNTGNKDFAYNDSFVDREDGFRHSMWLSFMEKRLRLAKRLLSDKGVIFISIDDNEQAQLKLLCDEVFVNQNFCGNIIWRKKSGGGQTDAFFVTEHEYISVYQSTSNFKWTDPVMKLNPLDFKYEDAQGRYNLTKLEKWGSSAHKEDRPSMYFPIIDENGRDFYPTAPDGKAGRWRVGLERMDYLRENDLVIWKRGIPYEKNYYNSGKEKIIKSRSILYDVAENGDGANLLTEIFGKKDTFNNSKPVELIMNLIKHHGNKSATILDFFAGSGTTLHATMQLNKEDGGKRKCILVTNNENGICENVTYVRNKKVIEGYTTPKGLEVEGLKDNNLRYYQVELMERERSFACRNELQQKGVDMLCIKEDIYAEQPTFGKLQAQNDKLRYFAEGGREMLVVLDYEWIGRIVGELKGMETTKKIKVYVSCPKDYPFTEEFEEVAEKVELIPFPAQFLNIYNKVAPKMREKSLDGHAERELTEEEMEETAEDYLPSETTGKEKEEAQW